MMGVRAVVVGLCVLASACEIRIASRLGDDTLEAACGNFNVDPGEVCDDGNTGDGDGCSADCRSDETCGNGVVDLAMDETCDDGDLRGGDGCSADCKSDETCGNGVIDLAKGETCDDGNLIALDGCSANCQSSEECGNGVVDMVTSTGVSEECDTGGQSASCNANCTFTRCPDGVVNMAAGEECDDNNLNNGDQCDNLCRNVVCGNSRTEGNEQCDDGNGSTTDNCVNCRFAFCGDGFTQAGVEGCDDANANLNDACTVSCQAAFCGDGFLRSGVEGCDDGNGNDGDGCSAACQFEPRTYFAGFNELVHQEGFCDGTGENRYDNCDAQPYGFSWFDSTPFTPGTIEITFNRGIDCFASQSGQTFAQYVVTTNVNNANFQDIVIDSDFDGCNCFPTKILHTAVFSGAGYNQNGQNTFLLNGTLVGGGFGICAGFSPEPGFGGAFAKITVYP